MNNLDVPERELIAAVLERALLDYTDVSCVEGMDAQFWIYSNETRPWSYVWCCAVLDIDPDAIRDQLAKGTVGEALRAARFGPKASRRKLIYAG